MNDLIMTVSGWVATEPKYLAGPSGARMTTFRLASTSRYFDRDKSEWVDGRTEWFTVRVFRSAAVTVADSVEKGQPVMVHGRFKTNTWESESGPRTDVVIDATSVGHDLTRGVAKFKRATGVSELPDAASPPAASGAEDGAMPAEDETGEPDALAELELMEGEPADVEPADDEPAEAEPTEDLVAAR